MELSPNGKWDSIRVDVILSNCDIDLWGITWVILNSYS